MTVSTQKPARRSTTPLSRGWKSLLIAAGAAAGAISLVASASSLVGVSTAGYSDTVYAQAEGVSVPPTTALASVVPSYALDTMQVLDAAGNLWIWGYYGNDGGANCTLTSSAAQGGGRCGINYSTGTGFNLHKPNQFTAMTGIQSMASSAYANYVIDSENNLFGWGQNNGGLYMFGHNFNGPGRVVPTGTTPANVTTNWSDAIIDTDVVSVASVEYGAAYSKSDGSVWTVGDNGLAQRGQGTSGNGAPALRVATQVTAWPAGATPTLMAVYSGYEGYYAVSEDNTVYFWGRSFRQGAGATSAELTAAGCTVISAVYSDFQCRTPVVIPSLTAIAQSEGIKSLGGGYGHGHVVTAEGNLYSWGGEQSNSSGNDALIDNSSNGTAPFLKATDVISASARFASTQYITADGTAWAYGDRLWGGAFTLNVPARTPANTGNLTGKIWDPAADSLGRKAVAIGGNKDSASVVIDDGTILSWGENGGGAACGGYSGADCRDKNGNIASVVPGGTPNGLYVWPPAVIEGIQNVGRYQTVSLNSNPFTGSAVMSGSVISYQAVARNTFADPEDFTVGVDVSAIIGDMDIDPGSIHITVGDSSPVSGAVNAANKIEWSGEIPKRSQVLISFDAVVKPGTAAGVTLAAQAYMSAAGGNSDTDAVSHVTTTNPDDLEDCDSCNAP